MMKRAWAARAGAFGGALVAAWAMSAGVAQSCERDCPAAAPKDVLGCCIFTPPPIACPEGFTFELDECRPLNPPTSRPEPAARAKRTLDGLAYGEEGMVYVGEGYFIRGSNKGEHDERPEGRVWLDGYWIDAHEVTVGQYEACVRAGACAAPKSKGGEHDNWGADGPRLERLRHPINGVDWAQAAAFCAWKGKRLPTEAEWEKAARGVDGRTYPWGEAKASCARAVMNDGGLGCGEGGTWEVGSKPEGASPYGAHDMAGNVWEWTADRYHGGIYALTNGRVRNPTGPRWGAPVLRGGGWHDDGSGMRASKRVCGAPPPLHGGGFRCAGSLR